MQSLPLFAVELAITHETNPVHKGVRMILLSVS